MQNGLNIFWFRRDLRINDNAGLYHALKSGISVQPLFIFDENILNQLDEKKDRRVVFIHRNIEKLNSELRKHGSSVLVKHGKSLDVFNEIIKENSIKAVYTNHDYEPYARERDESVENLLTKNGIQFHSFKDQVIFEKDEITKDDGKPYTVFTPYMNKWRKTISDSDKKEYPTQKYFGNFEKSDYRLMTLNEIGFSDINIDFPSAVPDESIIKNYEKTRDIPGIDGTSRMSVHLRFGTISIRQLINLGWNLSDKWMNELIWREFYMMILWHFPHVVTSAFKSQYDFLQWRNNETEFKKWCEGKTGYPIVDAGMRELNETGFMHNRLRMITSMFLTKYLLIDWRWGEAYFAEKLNDYELSSNNGGWQWSAGTGVDAAPYFRIFSMKEQTKKFDPEFVYIKKWVPEFQELDYPQPMVDYEYARKRCLAFYKRVVSHKS